MTAEERALVHAIEKLCFDFRQLPGETFRGADEFHQHADAMQNILIAREFWTAAMKDLDSAEEDDQ